MQASIQMVNALEKAHAKEVNFKDYFDLMHDSWTMTYHDPDLYRWMLNHKREVKGDEEVLSRENDILLA